MCISSLGVKLGGAPMQPFESINGLSLPPELEARLRELKTRQAEGRLTASDRHELDLIVEAQEMLTRIRAKAKTVRNSAAPAQGSLIRTMRNGLPVMQVPAGTPAIDVVAVRRFLAEEAI